MKRERIISILLCLCIFLWQKHIGWLKKSVPNEFVYDYWDLERFILAIVWSIQII